MDAKLKELLDTVGYHGLVYRTGSKLTGVSNANSDDDFYMFYVPTKFELLTKDTSRGKTLHGDGWEAKTFMVEHLFNLLRKTNPNVIEMFFAEPLYFSNDCKQLAELLYTNREKLVNLDRKHFVKSSYGMLKSNIKRMTPDKEFNGEGSFGKEFYNFNKAFRYGLAVAEHRELEPEVFVTGDKLDGLRKMKSQVEFSEEMLASLDVDGSLNTLDKLLDDMTDEQNEGLLHQLTSVLPLAQGEE